MESRPLQYESLKVVLEHMDANLRFQLFKRIPSIRNVERLVPLKIDKFGLLYGITINNTLYQIGITKTYPSSEVVPDHVQKTNRSGGLRYDIDQLGFQDYSTRGTLEPGDIPMQTPSFLEYLENRQMEEQQKKQNPTQFIENKEKIIERWENDSNKRRGRADHLHQNPNSLSAMTDFEEIQSEIEPYYHLRDNTLPKYDTWIQLTMRPEFGEGKIKTERVKYNQKLHVAQKYLLNVLFGGRKADIRVKKLEILYSRNYVYRFPFGLKLKIRELKVDRTKVLENGKLVSLIDDSSYPLQQFTIDSTTSGLNFPIIKTAQKLVIIGMMLRIFPRVLNLSHKTVTCTRSSLSAQEFFLVIQTWLKSNREVGTEYVFTDVENEVADGLFKIVAERIGSVIAEKRSITIPMNHEAHLKVSCSFPDYPLCSIRLVVTRTI